MARFGKALFGKGPGYSRIAGLQEPNGTSEPLPFVERVDGHCMLRARALVPDSALSHADGTAGDARKVIDRFDRGYYLDFPRQLQKARLPCLVCLI
jgi:hypothetical protein